MFFLEFLLIIRSGCVFPNIYNGVVACTENKWFLSGISSGNVQRPYFTLVVVKSI
jgi:hypothetical protein